VPGAVGAWAACVESVNNLIADLAQPTTEVARVMGAVAKGGPGAGFVSAIRRDSPQFSGPAHREHRHRPEHHHHHDENRGAARSPNRWLAELQTRQEELTGTNRRLEEQARSLQASEERLKLQQ
jgi:hypothetical protein